MTKPEVAKTFFDIQSQLKHEGLLEEHQGAVKAALRAEDGTVYLAELDGAGVAMQELATASPEEPFLYAFAVKPEAKMLLLLRGTYAVQIADGMRALTAELDDMAQIVGLTARVAAELTPKEIERCLRGRNSCFVKGEGMLITGRSISEALTGAILLEKAAMTHLLAKKIGGAKRVPLFSAALMHYLPKSIPNQPERGEHARAGGGKNPRPTQPAQTARERAFAKDRGLRKAPSGRGEARAMGIRRAAG
jgi:hypothetical protein